MQAGAWGQRWAQEQTEADKGCCSVKRKLAQSSESKQRAEA